MFMLVGGDGLFDHRLRAVRGLFRLPIAPRAKTNYGRLLLRLRPWSASVVLVVCEHTAGNGDD
jgi:hypothetical protein